MFRYIIDAEARQDHRSSSQLLAMLSDRKQRTVRELRTFDGGRILEALKPLLPFGALFYDLLLGSINLILPMRCPEVNKPNEYSCS